MNTTNSRFKTTMVALILCGVLSGMFITPAGAQSSDPILSTLPKDTLICIRVNNFTYSVGQLDQYLAGASPVPMGVSMIINMQLAGMLGDPMMTGIDRNGTFAVIGLMPDMEEPDEPVMMFLFPVSSFQTFTSSNPNCTETDDKGIFKVSPPNSPLGDILTASVADGKFMLIGEGGELEEFKAVLSMIKNKKASLAQAVLPEDVKRAVEAPAWLYVNLETGYQLASPWIKESMNEAVTEMQKQQGQPPMSEEAMQAMIDACDRFLRQLHSASLALTPKPDVLLAETWLSAKADSDMAKSLIRKQPFSKGFKYAGVLDTDSPMLMLCKINKPLWNEFYSEFMDLLINATGQDNELAAKFQEMINKSMAATGEEVAADFGYGAGTPPFFLHEIFEVKDPKVMRDLFAENMAFITQIYEKMGMPVTFKVEKDAVSYKQTAIDKVTASFEFPDSGSAETAMIEAMYGKDGLQYPLAITDKAMLLTMGPDSMTEIKGLIDRSGSAGKTPARIDMAQKLLTDADTADMLMTFDFIGFMKGMSGMMAAMKNAIPEGEGAPDFTAMFEGIPMESTSAMALAARLEDGKVKLQYALPKAHLKEITNVMMQIQQKMMMQQMQQQQMSPQTQP